MIYLYFYSFHVMCNFWAVYLLPLKDIKVIKYERGCHVSNDYIARNEFNASLIGRMKGTTCFF